jgi:hypothetical protein
MRLAYNAALVVAAAISLAACRPDEVINTSNPPVAGVRFIHAVPDTAAMDFRFVDMVENSAHWNIFYRNNVVTSGGVPASTVVQYKPARAGERHFRIFMNGGCTATACDQAYASTVVKDTTVTLEAGKNYTALLIGYANPGGPNRPAGAPAMRLIFFEETVADPGANVALRLINATPNAIDGRYYVSTGAVPATAQFANVGPVSPTTTGITAHQTTAPEQYRYNVQPAGGGASLIGATDPLSLPGSPAVLVAPGPFDAIPGTTVAGSAVTAIVFAPQVCSTAVAATASCPNLGQVRLATTTLSQFWDRRPPRPAGT